MYGLMLFIHSLTRWLVVLGTLFFFFRSLKGWIKNEEWTTQDTQFVWGFNQVFGCQILFGFTMWLGLSPITMAIFKDFNLIRENFVMLFWFALHGTAMILCLGFFHMAKAKARRTTDSKLKFKIFTLTLALIIAIFLMAIPWPWYQH
jgi:heme/copper-type cytochrome/quinol oxidase subunit 4